MIITRPKHKIYSKQAALYKWKKTAMMLVYKYRWGAAEYSLNLYLLKTYKISLVNACKLLLNTCKVGEIHKDAIEIFWLDKKYDKLLHIIMNGIGNIHGSNIINYAFR